LLVDNARSVGVEISEIVNLSISSEDEIIVTPVGFGCKLPKDARHRAPFVQVSGEQTLWIAPAQLFYDPFWRSSGGDAICGWYLF
jgi:hypothetical protein